MPNIYNTRVLRPIGKKCYPAHQPHLPVCSLHLHLIPDPPTARAGQAHQQVAEEVAARPVPRLVPGGQSWPKKPSALHCTLGEEIHLEKKKKKSKVFWGSLMRNKKKTIKKKLCALYVWDGPYVFSSL